MSRLSRSIALILPLLVAQSGLGQEGESWRQDLGDEALLRRLGLSTDAAILRLLHDRSRVGIDNNRLDGLIRQFGADEFERREQASREVVVLGRNALPRLTEARNDPDLEVRRRVTSAIEEIRKGPDVAPVAVRELIRRRVGGAAAALLEYLPYSDTETEHVIYVGLKQVALRNGKIDQALRTAVTDPNPARRALAALTLGHLGDETDRRAVCPCLADSDSLVRLRAAQGLYGAHDVEALPAFVDLCRAAIDCLRANASGTRPSIPILAALMSDPKTSTSVRIAAARTLVHMGPAAREMFPAYLDVFKETDAPNDLLIAITEALFSMPDYQGLPPLIRAAKEGTFTARRNVIEMFGAMTSLPLEGTPPALKGIRKALLEIAESDEDVDVRVLAWRSLQPRMRRGKF